MVLAVLQINGASSTASLGKRLICTLVKIMIINLASNIFSIAAAQ